MDQSRDPSIKVRSLAAGSFLFLLDYFIINQHVLSSFSLDYFIAKGHSLLMSQTAKKKSHGGKRAGAGRKPQYDEAVMIAALIPAKLRDKLDRFAKAKDLSRSQAIVEAIRQLK
jgi:hypothetical protein